MFTLALEAMQATAQSKFGRELDALWQSVIDYRDKELQQLDYRVRYKKVKEFFHQNITKKFMDLTWKHTGLWISECRYVELWDSGFCTWMSFGSSGSGIGTLQIENVLNGGYTEKYWHMKIPDELSAKDLVTIASSYDAITGSIKKEDREKIKNMVQSVIGFDIRTGFLLEDFLPKGSGVSNFSAQEITAIVLHEIGHTLTLIEHCADLYARTSAFNYLSAAYMAAHDTDYKAAVNLTREAAAVVKMRGNADAASKISNLASKFEADFAKAGAAGDPPTKKKLIGGLIMSVMYILFDAILIPIEMLFGNSSKAKFKAADQKKKFGDLRGNGRMITWQERKADEYAFSHGYGAAQVNALYKLGQLFTRIGKSEEEIEKINSIERLHKNISLMDKFKILVYAPLVCGDWGYSLYPAGCQRFKELLNLSVQQLKANAADPELVRKYMEDIEIIQGKIDNCNKYDEYMAKVIRGYETFNSYISIPGIFDCIVHGRVARELDNLLDDIQRLGNNMIHFYGMKMQALAQKRKGSK